MHFTMAMHRENFVYPYIFIYLFNYHYSLLCIRNATTLKSNGFLFCQNRVCGGKKPAIKVSHRIFPNLSPQVQEKRHRAFGITVAVIKGIKSNELASVTTQERQGRVVSS